MEFTGERLVPGKAPTDLYREHITRYLFAKEFVKPGSQVLDLGSGAGYGSAELASAGAGSVVGVDISAEAVAYAAAQYGSGNVRFAEMDCRKLEFADASFDTVVSFEVIEHIAEVDAYLAGIRRVLREDGVFIVSTPNKKMYSDALPDYDNPYHVKEYYYQEFVELLQAHFPYVSIYLQDFMQGMRIQPHAGQAADGLAGKVELEPGTAQAEQSSFFVAVCSGLPVAQVREMIFPFAQSNILAEKDKHIEVLQGEVALRDESVTALQREAKELQRWVASLQREAQELQRWVASLQEEVAKRDDSVHALLRELAAKGEELARLQNEVRERDRHLFNLRALTRRNR